jgi:hypothetical protein
MLLNNTVKEIRQLPRGTVTNAEKSIGAYSRNRKKIKTRIHLTTICGGVKRDMEAKSRAVNVPDSESSAFISQLPELEKTSSLTMVDFSHSNRIYKIS